MSTGQDETGIRVEDSAWIPPVIWQILVDGEWKAVSFTELVEHQIGDIFNVVTVPDEKCQPVKEGE